MRKLLQVVSCNLPESMWSNLFNTPAHLMSFLRLFSDSFHIQANLVTLLQHPRVSQKHIQTQILDQAARNLRNNVKERSVEKTNPDQTKNIKNLVNNENNTDDSKQYIEKMQSVQLSPKSISDRLRQPKMQQKLNEAAQAKNSSPEPVEVQQVGQEKGSNEDLLQERTKVVNFRTGKFCLKFGEEILFSKTRFLACLFL